MKLYALCKIILALPLLAVLCACAAQTETPAEPGVEDITPGQRSIITAPAGGSGSQQSITEKNI